MTIAVRRAEFTDIPWLLGQLRQFDTFFGSSRSLFPTEEHAERILTDLIATQPILVAHDPHKVVYNGDVATVKASDGDRVTIVAVGHETPINVPLKDLSAHLIGFICGAIHPHPYNPDLIVLSEMFWWVAEEYRGSKAGLALLNDFIAVGKAKAHWIIMTLESESKVDPDHLYRRGFRLKELSFLLEVAA